MRIAVIPNPTKDKGLKNTHKLCNILSRMSVQMCMDEKYKESGINADFFCGEEIYNRADVAIVLGGDGTILQAAEPCAIRHIPVMGINLGRVGFMTETEQNDMECAAKMLVEGAYKIEERMMMDIAFMSEGKTLKLSALNDCVVSKPDAQMIRVGVFAGGEEITEYIADGTIIATPTGSTGYSLSAGGPVADPGTDVFLSTPICAHTLHARPSVLAPEKKIEVRLFEGANKFADVTVDGIVKGKIGVGGSVEIKRSGIRLKLIKFGRQSFYDILAAKLM